MSARRCEQATKALNDMRLAAVCERDCERHWRLMDLPGCGRYPSYQEWLAAEADIRDRLDDDIPF